MNWRRISIPPNCGQQIFDVVTVNDARCGITGELYRITDIETVYQPPRRQYRQTLTLAAPQTSPLSADIKSY